MQDQQGAGHAGDAVEGRVAFVDEAACAGGPCHGAADEGEEAEGEGAGVVERGGGEAGEGGVEDDACVWCARLFVYVYVGAVELGLLDWIVGVVSW